MALRRFMSRRNTPDTIILDNAPQFKLTKTTMDKAWKSTITDEKVQGFTSNVGIKWKFIVEFSPWMGGFYERLVGMVKSSLRKAIQKKFLSTTQFRTYATECERILNSRPLVYIDDDIKSVEAITPNHFLCLNLNDSTPILEDDGDPDFKPSKDSADELLEIWRQGQSKLNEFWKYWYNDYLLSLRERYQSHLRQPRIKSGLTPKIGQIVHVKEDLPRSRWKMGRITHLIKSKDHEIRAANVLLPNGNIIKRPINLLYPLETALIDNAENKNETNDKDEMKIVKERQRPKRDAAVIAKYRLKELFNDEIGNFVWCRECHES